MVAIISDIRKQKNQAWGFALRLILFLLLLFLADRLLGWALTRGLERYFGLDQPAEILAIGHSHTVLGLDKMGLERQLDMKVAKYARQGANVIDRLAMLRHYLECQPNSAKLLIYGVDAYTFSDHGLSANSYRLFFPFMNRQSVREFLRQQCKKKSEYLLRIFSHSTRFNEETAALAVRGWMKSWANLKWGNIDINRQKQKIAEGDYRRIRFDDDSIRLFADTIHLARQHDISVVLTFFPTLDLLNQTQPEKYAQALQLLRDFVAETPGVHLLEYNPEFEHRYELFYDAIHLNPEGRKVITDRIAEDIQKILKQQKL